ncbi:tetratricopeptide repeat protein, partial [Nocardiopsis sp. TNDT3]|uniref:tetratricopeptide repeat protein n=1 Tax=Nocardiopsis sp. TNDT3 TaxID=2249354 RepID=UPI0013009839
VATSREGLHSLAGAHHLGLDVLAPEAAVALLVSDLSGHTPEDPRVDNEAELGRLAALCGWLPLALEIAAAYLKRNPQLIPERLANRLENAASRVDKLKDPDRGTGQTRVLRAVFDTSLAYLDQSVAKVFLLVAAAPGPTLSTTAAAVLTDLPADEAEEALEELAAAHLLTQPAPGRWGAHDLLADYARHHPHPPQDRHQSIVRLLDHYMAATAVSDDHLRTLPRQPISSFFPGPEAALGWLDTERATLVAAAMAAPALGHTEAAIHLPLNLSYYLGRRRRFEDAEQVLRSAQRAAHTIGNAHAEATAQTNLGTILMQTRRFDDAIIVHTRAREAFYQTGDTLSEAMAWNNLGAVLAEVRQFQKAIEAHLCARNLYQQVGDTYGQAQAWNNLGTVQAQALQLEEAIEAHTRACDLYQQVGNAHGEALVRTNLGATLRQMRRFKEAVEVLDLACQAFHQAGDTHSEAMAWNNLGLALRQVGRFDKAINAHTRACILHRQVGDTHAEAQAWGGLGVALLKAGRRTGAAEAAQRAVKLFESAGDHYRSSHSRVLLALIQQEPGDDAPA